MGVVSKVDVDIVGVSIMCVGIARVGVDMGVVGRVIRMCKLLLVPKCILDTEDYLS